MRIISKKKLTLLVSIFSLSFGSSFCYSRQGIEEVIVTAQKDEENIQDVPIAITAITSEQLSVRGITGYQEVLRSNPSVSVSPYQVSTNQFFVVMRGLGQNADIGQPGLDPVVGLYQDGFYIARTNLVSFDLGEVERVEVLRGPQGTLYGRNSIGGAINYISKKPSGEFGLKQTLTFGSRDIFRSLTTVDLPEWNGLSIKFSLVKKTEDGWVKNPGSSHDFYESGQRGGRIQFLWNLNEKLSLDYFSEVIFFESTAPAPSEEPIKIGNSVVVNGASYIYDVDRNGGRPDTAYRAVDQPLNNGHMYMHGMTLNWEINSSLMLKSLTGFRSIKDNRYANLMDSFGFGDIRGNHDLNASQFSQEIQVVGNAFDDRVRYVGGLYYFREDPKQRSGVIIPAFNLVQATDFNSTAYSKAVYGQATWAPDLLEEKLEITVGARYTEDKKKASRIKYNKSFLTGATTAITEPWNSIDVLKYSKFNPAFTVNYHWADDISTYATISTGYKAGGASYDQANGRFNSVWNPEKVKNIELGAKTDWLGGTVRANLAIFHTKFEGRQRKFQIDPNQPGLSEAVNLGDEIYKGVELELTMVPIDGLTLSINYAYLKHEVDNVPALSGTVFDPSVNIYSPYSVGQNIGFLFEDIPPESNFNVSADYTFVSSSSGSLSGHIDWRYEDEYIPADLPGAREFGTRSSYDITNASLTLEFNAEKGGEVKLIAWINNIFDQDEAVGKSPFGGSNVLIPLNANPVIPYSSSSYRAWVEPRSYGLTMIYDY